VQWVADLEAIWTILCSALPRGCWLLLGVGTLARAAGKLGHHAASDPSPLLLAITGDLTVDDSSLRRHDADDPFRGLGVTVNSGRKAVSRQSAWLCLESTHTNATGESPITLASEHPERGATSHLG
jgi:hypothetical protein